MKLKYRLIAFTLVGIMAFTFCIMLSMPGQGPEFMRDCPTWLRFGGGFTILIVTGSLLVEVLTEKTDL